MPVIRSYLFVAIRFCMLQDFTHETDVRRGRFQTWVVGLFVSTFVSLFAGKVYLM